MQFTTTDHVAVDFESFFDKRQKITIKDLGAYYYVRTAEIYLVAIHDGEQSFVGHPRDFDWSSIAGRHWVSHNRSFDRECYLALVELGVIEAVDGPSAWDCSSDLSTWCRCMRNLKAAARELLGLEASKEVRNLMNGLTITQMKESVMAENGKLYPLSSFHLSVQVDLIQPGDDGFDGTFYGDVCRYCLHDAIICWQLWAVHAHRWPENERRISRLTGEQGSHGIPMDVLRLKRDLVALQRACEYAKAQLPWMWTEVDGNWAINESDEGTLSIPALKAAITSLGVTPPTTTSEDSEACRAWELKHPDIQLVRFMRDFRKCNTLRRRYEHVLSRLKPDGRFPFAWLYGGAHTLRWAGGSDFKKGGTGETGFNVQNMPKEPTYLTFEFEVTDKDHEHSYVINLRACCVAGPGKKWMCADAEQIEARITLWLAGELESLAMVAAGMSIYEVHARKTMGWKGGNIKQEDPDQQFMAKNRVLALGFQCGKVKFHDRCRELGFPIDMREAGKQVADFRNKERKIKALWYRLHNEIEGIARRNSQILRGTRQGELEDYEVELPSGRSLVYFKPWIQTAKEQAEQDAQKAKKGKVPPVKRWKTTNVCARTELGGRIKWFYGGLILENIAQAIARDVLCHMMLNLDDAGIPMLFSVHDEEDLEADQHFTCAEVKEIMERMPDWCEGLPVSVEVKEDDHYFK